MIQPLDVVNEAHRHVICRITPGAERSLSIVQRLVSITREESEQAVTFGKVPIGV